MYFCGKQKKITWRTVQTVYPFNKTLIQIILDPTDFCYMDGLKNLLWHFSKYPMCSQNLRLVNYDPLKVNMKYI